MCHDKNQGRHDFRVGHPAGRKPALPTRPHLFSGEVRSTTRDTKKPYGDSPGEEVGLGLQRGDASRIAKEKPGVPQKIIRKTILCGTPCGAKGQGPPDEISKTPEKEDPPGRLHCDTQKAGS